MVEFRNRDHPPMNAFAHPPIRRETHFGDRVVRCFADRPASMHGLLEQSASRHPDRTALCFADRRWSWRELDTTVGRLAAALAARGIGRGDRVAMLISNRPEFVFVLFATQRLGAIAVPISVREQGPGLAYIVEHCGARAVIHDDDLAERLPPPALAPALTLRLAAGELEALCTGSGPLLGTAVDVQQEDTAVILYTSGTTGRPKGAMLSHFTIVHSTMHFEAGMRLTHEDVSAMVVPASHVTGLIAMIATMARVGGALVVIPAFKAAEFLALAARHRITHTILVPAMYNLCLLQPDFDAHDLSAWRIGCYGGAPMPSSTIEALAGKLPDMTLMNCYGATETTSPVTMMPPGQQASHLDSVGIALPCVELLVVDDEGREVPPGAPGELLVGGPMVVGGYWNNPEATAQSFVGGFWRSGDIGSIDADGYVRIFDRKKDMINRGGYKIWSVEVENALMGHPDVVEAAVVGVPCPVLGERVAAFVQVAGRPAESAEIETALRNWCSERLADYKVPETLVLSDGPLPRNANGKLMKRELRQRLVPPMAV
jgi:long-chain acyl-CoA synthetase